MSNTIEHTYWTISDIEREARQGEDSTFKGRANESITGFAQAHKIPIDKAKKLSKRNVEEYQFPEDIALLFVALLRVKGLRPISHGNQKTSRVPLQAMHDYTVGLLKELSKLPPHILDELSQEENFQEACRIHNSLVNLPRLFEQIELLFYMSPPSIAANLLEKVEQQAKYIIQETFNEMADLLKGGSTNQPSPTPIDGPKIQRVKQNNRAVKVKVARYLNQIARRVDPHTHFLDRVVANHITKLLMKLYK